MNWAKTGTEIYSDGGKTITYDPLPESLRTYGIRIESRKQAIPHANGDGYWMHTNYCVMDGDETVNTHFRLQDAKAAAESIIRERQAAMENPT